MRITHFGHRAALLIMLMLTLTMLSVNLRADQGNCGGQVITLPFTDVMGSGFFCQIAAAYFSGLTNGTTRTTYSPGNNVSREQMAAFVTRTLDQSAKRGNPRAALGEWWTSSAILNAPTFTGYHNPQYLASDGLTVWVSNTQSDTVSRVDIRTSAVICTLTGIPSPQQIVIVGGWVFVASFQSPGSLYYTDMRQVSDGVIPALPADTGPNPVGVTFDGQALWTANSGGGPGSGSITRITPIGLGTSTFTTGFSQPAGILFDGANLWVTDKGDTSLKRVDKNTGTVLQTTALSGAVSIPIFDGTNLWIPCGGIGQLGIPDKVFVVRGVGDLTGTVLAELTGNGLNGAFQAAFDGERVCVTNASGQSVSLWRATDLSPITSVNVAEGSGRNPRGVCSDGTHFFVGVRSASGGSGLVARL